MKKFIDEKIIFDKIFSIFNLANFRPLHILDNELYCILCEIISSYSLQRILLKLCRYVTDILKMCMKKFNEEKILFDKFTAF